MFIWSQKGIIVTSKYNEVKGNKTTIFRNIGDEQMDQWQKSPMCDR